MASQGLNDLASKWGVSSSPSYQSSSSSPQGSSLNALAQKWSAPKATPTASPTPAKPINQPRKIVQAVPTPQADLLQRAGSVFKGVVGEVGSIIKQVTAPKPAQPKPLNLPNNIKLNFVDAPTSGQEAQLKVTPKSVARQKQSTEDLQNTNTVLTLQGLAADPLSLKAHPTRAVSQYIDTVKQSFQDAQTKLDVINAMNKKTPYVQQVGKRLSGAAAGVNAAISPFTALFEAATNVPVLGTISSLVSLPFVTIGDVSPKVSDKVIDSIPNSVMSRQTKDSLKGGVGEMLSLALQLVAGHAVDALPGKVKELTKKYGVQDATTIVDQAQKLAEQKKAATTNQATYSPQDLRNKVFQLGIENSPIGKGILKAAQQAEKTGKFVQEGELPTETSSSKGLTAPADLLVSHEGAPDTKTVEQYKADIQAGKQLEPLKVIREGEKYGIEDGKHRYQAYKELGIKDIPIEVVEGKTKEAATSSESVAKLSKESANSLENNQTGIKEGAIERAKKEIQAGNTPPVRIRQVEGKQIIEDGRHHLEAAKQLGLKDYPVEDVTSQYASSSTKVPLSKVETGLSDLTAKRIKTDTPKIKAYEEAIKKGEKLPPVPVYEENDKYVLNKDGFHRYQAHKNLGIKDIEVKVEPKTGLSASGKQRSENGKQNTSSGEGTPNPVGTGKLRNSEAFSKFVDQLKESDPKRYEELKDNKVKYNRLNLEKDAENALQLIEKDPERAYRISKGMEAPPEGQTETAISIGLANRAGLEKNFSMQADLESSRSLRQTRRGQEIVSERGRFTENSPHALIQRVLDERLKKIGKQYVTNDLKDAAAKFMKQKIDSAKARAIAKIDEQVEKARQFTKKEKAKIRSAQQVLDALTCK